MHLLCTRTTFITQPNCPRLEYPFPLAALACPVPVDRQVGPFWQLANKGAVGLAFRLYDVCLAFTTAHFAADKHGKSGLLARNQVRPQPQGRGGRPLRQTQMKNSHAALMGTE